MLYSRGFFTRRPRPSCGWTFGLLVLWFTARIIFGSVPVRSQCYVFLLSWLLHSSAAKTQSIFQWWHHPHDHHHHHPHSNVEPQIWALVYWCLLVASAAPCLSIKCGILHARTNWSQKFINWINLWLNQNLMRSRGPCVGTAMRSHPFHHGSQHKLSFLAGFENATFNHILFLKESHFLYSFISFISLGIKALCWKPTLCVLLNGM